MRRAVIDVGSNSVLLLVAEWRDGQWLPMIETSRVTSLGEGTKATGLLSEPSMAATLAALRDAYALASEVGVDSIRAGITMAGRIANNTPDFLARAEAQRTPCFVLSGNQEAELGLKSVTEDPEFAAQPRITIIDVGGQSTELVTADRGVVDLPFRKSFAIGTLALRTAFNDKETLDGLDLLRASQMIDEVIGIEYLPHQCGTVVALGASATNLVTIRERMTEWNPSRVHGAYLDYEEISKAVGWLGRMTDDERAAVVGLEPGRERTVHWGALLLERFLYATHGLGVRVSVRGWRHALLATEPGNLGE
ncbi:MAG: hypothetical protein IT363_00590 [Methanoregulaceae archaeon]|nr:hypothetical protein [Methanoregulaceae archaeon]